MDLVIFSAKYLFLLSIGLALIIFATTPHKKELLKLTVLTLPLSFILAKLASLVFYNPRPFVVENVQPLISHAADNGFPSDHTLLAMTIAAIIFQFNKKLGLSLIIVGLIVGVSRVLVKVHHPVDILGSTVIAFAATYGASYLLRRFRIP